MDELREVVDSDDRELEAYLARRTRGGVEQIALATDGGSERRDELLADRVERWIRHLRKQLEEVIEQQPWSIRQRRDGRVRAHRTDRLHASRRHRGEDEAEIFLGDAEQALLVDQRLVVGNGHLSPWEVADRNEVVVHPPPVRSFGCEARFDLCVLDDAPGPDVGEEYSPWRQASFAGDAFWSDVEHADLGSEHDQSIGSHPIAPPVADRSGRGSRRSRRRR